MILFPKYCPNRPESEMVTTTAKLTTLQMILLFVMTLIACPWCEAITEQQRAIVDRLRPSLQVLCPGVDICGNVSEPAKNAIFNDTLTSCCKACSCAEDCARGTCCFGEADVIDDDSPEKCLWPAAYDTEFSHNIDRYYITDRAPSGGCLKKETTCNHCDDRVYPWGNIWPVVSNTSIIYNTPSCAECHGLSRDEYSQWALELVCMKEPKEYSYFPEYFELMIKEQRLYEGCSVIFYNVDQQYLGNKRCYNSLVQECKSHFEIPEELDMSRDEIIEACEIGPRMPVSIGKSLTTFYNPFCYICFGGFPEHIICKVENSTGIKTISVGSFSVLISSEKVIDLIMEEQISIPQACKSSPANSSEEETCKDVVCPLAQYRDKTGRCEHLTDRWLDVDYIVMLDLHIDPGLPSTTVVYEGIIEEMIESLGTPTTWKMNAYFHVYPCDSTDIQYTDFTVSFVVDNRAPLKRLLKTIEGILKRQHYITVGDLGFQFNISINKYYQFESVSRGSNTLTPAIPPLDTPMNFTKYCYDTVKYRGIINFLEFGVTKLFFCEQIMLQPAEYHLNGISVARALEYNGRVFYPGEFAVDTGYNDDATTVKVCLEDTDYIKIERVGLNKASHALRGRVTIVLSCLIFIFALLTPSRND